MTDPKPCCSDCRCSDKDAPDPTTGLRPCPFCGGAGGIFHHTNHGDYVGWLQHDTDWWVACEERPGDDESCGATIGMFASEEEAIAAWNSRPKAPTD